MKILTALIAAAVSVTGFATVPAAAQRHDRVVVRERHVVNHRGNWRNHRRTVCRIERRGHHRRVRVCRTVRY